MKEILIPLATGLTIFLFGMQLIRMGLQELAGDHMRRVIRTFTRTPVHGFITGTLSTAVLQSSSMVTVLTIGFVHSGFLTFPQSIGVILGTNIGTTLTTEILTLNIEDFALPLILFGASMRLFPNKVWANIGLSMAGFGCIFLGMEAIQWIAEPLKERGLVDWMLFDNHSPVWSGILVGTLLTAIIQSSSASIAMTMGFFATGLIPLPFALAIILGSNIGTCITGLIAAIGTIRPAQQVAVAHLILNVGGAILFAPLIDWFAAYTTQLQLEPASQIAHFQTIYNVLCSLIVLPFATPFARLITTILPEQTESWRISTNLGQKK
ncbi:Na/Pi cotransporter family protein [Mechercharimyces sp. CAU 1602]|uniref:Na/Pi cotransporter family protein n=1 Tax=Mechercharimyces sp. CAU 1602 TaxID=2973933 RepID=UPI00216333B2|nr:Na/Pi symporter [Mechercharimyces sp. CAU 1602]MCS1350455.1 Na/Pi symporter [Mechercharimyces sp. CAU 1602]